MPLNYFKNLIFNGVLDNRSEIVMSFCNTTENSECIDLNNQTNKDAFISKYGAKHDIDVNYLNT